MSQQKIHDESSFKRILKEYNSPDTSKAEKEFLEFIFPELKESEDEKIRKELIGYFTGWSDKHLFRGFKAEQILAWLEKQGEQNNLLNFDEAEKEKNDFVSGQFVECRKSFNEFKELESYWFEYIGDDIYIGRSDNILNQRFHITPQQLFTLFTHQHCPKDNENQCEQKSTNKVKPKFKVGDWITNGKYTWKVTDIKPLDYILQSPDGDVVDDTISHVDEHFHLWTIQDAKAGDVLAFDWKDEWHWQKIVIFKSLNEFGVEGYGNTFKNGKLAFDEEVPYYSKTWTDTLQPATKEQRNILFQKMKEAGYEWDFEKKKLIEIKKQGEKESKEIDFADWDILNYIKDIVREHVKRDEEFNEIDNWLTTHYQEQKTSWSEEDKKKINGICNYLMCSDSPEGYTEWIDWLESLPLRINIQQKQGWSEEDEKRIERIVSFIWKNRKGDTDEIYQQEQDANWLRSLKS